MGLLRVALCKAVFVFVVLVSNLEAVFAFIGAAEIDGGVVRLDRSPTGSSSTRSSDRLTRFSEIVRSLKGSTTGCQ